MDKKKLLSIVILIVVLSAIWLGIQALKGWNKTEIEDQSSREETTFKVYFSSSEMSSGEDCSKVFPVERTVPSTEAVGAAALSELLKGPTEEEESEGYFTSLPEGVVLNSLNIEKDGTAYADFNEALNEGGGSCMMENRSAQITETLKQFPTVDGVIISVNGDIETALQP